MSKTNDNGPPLLDQVRVVALARTMKAICVSPTGNPADSAWVSRVHILRENYPEIDYPQVMDIVMPSWVAVKAGLVPPPTAQGWGTEKPPG